MSKRKSDASKKPTGRVGSLQFGGGTPAEYKPVVWPETKPGIEALVVARSFRASGVRGPDLRELYRLVAEPTMNPKENGLDVILDTDSGRQHLELIEAAPLRSGAGSYAEAPKEYVVGKLAMRIFDTFVKKSRIYGYSTRGVHLLVYSTDFRFELEGEVADLLSLWASRGTLCFQSIVYYGASSETVDRLTLLHPRPATELKDLDEASLGRQIIYSVDLSTALAIPNGVAINPGLPAKIGPGPISFDIEAELLPLDEPPTPGKRLPERSLSVQVSLTDDNQHPPA